MRRSSGAVRGVAGGESEEVTESSATRNRESCGNKSICWSSKFIDFTLTKSTPSVMKFLVLF